MTEAAESEFYSRSYNSRGDKVGYNSSGETIYYIL